MRIMQRALLTSTPTTTIPAMNTVKQLVKKHMLVSQDAPRLVALTRQRLQKQLMSAQKLAMKQAVNARITARPTLFNKKPRPQGRGFFVR